MKTTIFCKHCDSKYTITLDRLGNNGKLPIYCPYCRNKVTAVHDRFNGNTTRQ